MSGGPWMRRGGLPRPGERFPIFVPDLYPDCPRELESLRNASAPDNRDEQRRVADDPNSTLEQLVSVIGSYPARVHANPAWQLAVVTNVGLFSALRPPVGRSLLIIYFMRFDFINYYVRDATNSILCHYRMPHGISRKYLRPCLLAHLSLVWRPLFVEQHGAFSFELYIDCQSDSLGVAVRSHGHRDERGESGE